MAEPRIVTVTGAAGNIVCALLFRIASGQLFGPPRLPAALPAQDQFMADRRDEGQAR